MKANKTIRRLNNILVSVHLSTTLILVSVHLVQSWLLRWTWGGGDGEGNHNYTHIQGKTLPSQTGDEKQPQKEMHRRRLKGGGWHKPLFPTVAAKLWQLPLLLGPRSRGGGGRGDGGCSVPFLSKEGGCSFSDPRLPLGEAGGANLTLFLGGSHSAPALMLRRHPPGCAHPQTRCGAGLTREERQPPRERRRGPFPSTSSCCRRCVGGSSPGSPAPQTFRGAASGQGTGTRTGLDSGQWGGKGRSHTPQNVSPSPHGNSSSVAPPPWAGKPHARGRRKAEQET